MAATRHIKISSEQLAQEVTRALELSPQAVIRAVGHSMEPNVHHNSDMLVLVPPQRDTLKEGDVVMARTAELQVVVHRIIRADGESLTLKGDGNLHGVEHCLRSDVIATLAYVERDGRTIDVRSETEIQQSAIRSRQYLRRLRAMTAIKNTIKRLLPEAAVQWIRNKRNPQS